MHCCHKRIDTLIHRFVAFCHCRESELCKRSRNAARMPFQLFLVASLKVPNQSPAVSRSITANRFNFSRSRNPWYATRKPHLAIFLPVLSHGTAVEPKHIVEAWSRNHSRNSRCRGRHIRRCYHLRRCCSFCRS